MVKDLYSKIIIIKILIILPMWLIAQSHQKSNLGFVFGAETQVLIPYKGSLLSNYGSDEEVTLDTKIWGASLFADYYFTEIFFARLALGYEKVNQPKFNYYPFTLGFGFSTPVYKGGSIFYAEMGTHLGDLDRGRFIFRAKGGYGVPIFNRTKLGIGLVYSFQNLHKSFPGSTRGSNYYNFTSLGLFANLQFK